MTETLREDLTALVGSRICHDLISPLGAIGNGLELLQLSGLPQGPEWALIAESVENASARIRFFRIAYGAADSASVVRGAELRAVLRAMFHGGRLRLDWLPDNQPRAEAKLAFLVLQCLETALPYGGRIAVEDGHKGRRIRAEAERIVLDEPLWARLSERSGTTPLRPAQVQFGLLGDLIRSSHRRISVELAASSITVTI